MQRLGLPLSLTAVALILLSVPVLSADKQEGNTLKLDSNLPYQAQKGNPVTYQVDLRAVVTPPYQTKTLKVWVPIPPSDKAQEVTASEFSTFPIKVTPRIATEPVFGNTFAYFEFSQPQGAQIIEHRFRVKVWELHWNLDPAKVRPVAQWPRPFEPYLRGEQQAVVVDDRFRQLAREIVPATQGPAQDLASLFTWVHKHVTYDHDNSSLQASAVHALQHRAGHCSDYHGLCAAVGRAMHYPTRVTYGINPFPKQSPTHCKLEVFLPPYGWISFDVSETQKMLSDIRKDSTLPAARKEALAQKVRERLLRGFRDNTWFLQTKGTDYDLAPPAARKVAVVRTLCAEADGMALPDPDPANKTKREFAWMTAHQYTADRPVPYPFKEYATVEKGE